MNNSYYIYIISNWNNKILYIGVTNNLQRRLHEHKNKLITGFTKKYNVNKLVYFEEYSDIKIAIQREKYLKGKTREFKNSLIKKLNPKLKDLSLQFT